MSRAAEITLRFPDEERLYKLPIGRLRELQEKTDCGPMELLARLQAGTWRIDDVRETIRLGMIGGGLPAPEASKLIERYVDDQPLSLAAPYAQAVLYAAVIGAEDEPPGEAEAGEETATLSREESFASPASTEQVPRSGGRRAKSTTSPSGN